MNKAALITVLLIIALSLNAITISEAVQYAEDNSSLIKIAYENVKIREIETKQSISNFLPSLSFSGTYTKLDSVPSMRFPSPTGGFMTIQMAVADNYSAGIEMGQPIFMGGKLITGYRISRIQEEISKIEYEKNVSDIKMAVIQMFLTGLLLDDLHDMNRALYEASREHYENALSRYELGSVSKLELLSAEMSLKQLEPTIEDIKNQKRNIINSMKIMMGMSREEEIILEGSIGDIMDSIMIARKLNVESRDNITQIGMEKNRDLAITRKGVDVVSRAYTLAKYNFLPNIILFGNYQYANTVNRTQDSLVAFNDTLYFYDSFVWGLSISFDIFKGGSRVLDVLKSGHQYKQVKMAYANQIEQKKIDIETLLNNYEIARLNAESFTYTMSLAEEAFSMAKEQYRQGVISNSDYIDAEANYISAKLGYTQNLYNQIINYYSLLNAIGIL